MPRSKKGRLSGGARKEINSRCASDIVQGAILRSRPRPADARPDPVSEGLMYKAEGMLFARVIKIVDVNHAVVAMNTKRGPKELRASIPPLLSKRGATPISAGFVVAIFFGKDFDPDMDAIRPADRFGIEAIIDKKQAYALQGADIIPSWMVQDVDRLDPASASAEGAQGGFEFDYSGKKDDESDSEEETTAAAAGAGAAAPDFRRRAPIPEDAELVIDDI